MVDYLCTIFKRLMNKKTGIPFGAKGAAVVAPPAVGPAFVLEYELGQFVPVISQVAGAVNEALSKYLNWDVYYHKG